MPTINSQISATLQLGALSLNGQTFSSRPKASQISQLLGEQPRILPADEQRPDPKRRFLLWDAAGITSVGTVDETDITLHELIFTLDHHPSKRAPQSHYSGQLAVLGVARRPNESGRSFLDRVRHERSGTELQCDDREALEFWTTDPSTAQQQRFGRIHVMRSGHASLADGHPDDVWLYFIFPTPSDTPSPVSHSPAAQQQSPVFFESSSGRVAQAETIRIFVRWFWRSGWRLILLFIIGLLIWAYLSR